MPGFKQKKIIMTDGLFILQFFMLSSVIWLTYLIKFVNSPFLKMQIILFNFYIHNIITKWTCGDLFNHFYSTLGRCFSICHILGCYNMKLLTWKNWQFIKKYCRCSFSHWNASNNVFFFSLLINLALNATFH